VEISINCNEIHLNKLGLNPDPSQRPKLEWIIMILREMLTYLDKMY